MALVDYRSITKLNHHNWATWSRDVKMILIEKDLWEVTSQNLELILASIVEESELTSVDPKVVSTVAKRKDAKTREVKKKRGQAAALMYLSVEDDIKGLIGDLEDSYEMWDVLVKNFEPPSMARVVGLWETFSSCTMESGDTIGLYAARLKNILKQLQDAGHVLDEKLGTFQLIRNLPEEYKSIVQMIYRWEDPKFKFDAVLTELLAEENRLRYANGTASKLDKSTILATKCKPTSTGQGHGKM